MASSFFQVSEMKSDERSRGRGETLYAFDALTFFFTPPAEYTFTVT